MDQDETAWMIRDDGKAISCVQHIYGNPDCIEETLYAAEWLFYHTRKGKTRNRVRRFLSAYADSLNSCGSRTQALFKQIEKQPYTTLTHGFIEKVGTGLRGTKEDLSDLNRQVCDALNEEFLRVRRGGLYHTEEGNRDLYVRVSSDTYPWEDVARSFLRNYAGRIDTLTVVYDEESTGKGDFLRDAKGLIMDHLPENLI